MAVATQLGMCASSFCCPSPVAAKPGTPTVTQPVYVSTTLVVCNQGNTENHSISTSRRYFAVAAAFASTLGVFAHPRAAEAKRNKPPPPPPQVKEVETEDKSLSAYDARLLANARRREAMKENVDKLKAKAASVTKAASVENIGTAEPTGTAEPAETAS